MRSFWKVLMTVWRRVISSTNPGAIESIATLSPMSKGLDLDADSAIPANTLLRVDWAARPITTAAIPDDAIAVSQVLLKAGIPLSANSAATAQKKAIMIPFRKIR